MSDHKVVVIEQENTGDIRLRINPEGAILLFQHKNEVCVSINNEARRELALALCPELQKEIDELKGKPEKRITYEEMERENKRLMELVAGNQKQVDPEISKLNDKYREETRRSEPSKNRIKPTE